MASSQGQIPRLQERNTLFFLGLPFFFIQLNYVLVYEINFIYAVLVCGKHIFLFILTTYASCYYC